MLCDVINSGLSIQQLFPNTRVRPNDRNKFDQVLLCSHKIVLWLETIITKLKYRWYLNIVAGKVARKAQNEWSGFYCLGFQQFYDVGCGWDQDRWHLIVCGKKRLDREETRTRNKQRRRVSCLWSLIETRFESIAIAMSVRNKEKIGARTNHGKR